MRAISPIHLPFSIIGLASLIGRTVSIDAWAEGFRVPHRKSPGAYLSGEEVRRITSIESKSWDPELFRDFSRIVEIGRAALAAARVAPEQIDLVIVATATPYEIMLDSDAFRLLRALRIPDHVAPIQLNAGCAGLARTMQIAAQVRAQRILVVTYEISSLYMDSPVYRSNATHPLRDVLWMSPAIFSDGAAAMVLARDEAADGFATYSRDSQSFGAGAGFEDRLVHYLGGGGLHPPGTPGSEELACFAMSGEHVKRYYSAGMMLNHEALARHRPNYLREVARIYTHQASPRLVEGFLDEFSHRFDVPREMFATNTREYGNLVIPSTLKMLHDDVLDGRVGWGDSVCVSVVGAGPERGAYILRVTQAS